MIAHFWTKIIELPLRLTEAVVSALVIREILRQIDRVPPAARAVTKRRRERRATLAAARIYLDAAIHDGADPAEWAATARLVSQTTLPQLSGFADAVETLLI
jgi:hypothetical protein